MTFDLNRREMLGTMLLTSGLGPARAASGEMEAAILAFTGGVVPQPGKVTLDIAPLVENGNSVAVSVGVDHPMRHDAHVTTIALFTEKNPQPNVATFHLSPRSGRAFVATRMRLATSQHVAAVARLSDGSLWSDIREVIVTIAACTEE
ncbi:MAG TPA: SoxY-related AACIE arm protein [Beijerinckiaceae bacterium]|nr:SoxY-related AACIE arm protein [Beijerinckiaceae bacterium]